MTPHEAEQFILGAPVRHWFTGTLVEPMQEHSADCPGCRIQWLEAEVLALRNLLSAQTVEGRDE